MPKNRWRLIYVFSFSAEFSPKNGATTVDSQRLWFPATFSVAASIFVKIFPPPQFTWFHSWEVFCFSLFKAKMILLFLFKEQPRCISTTVGQIISSRVRTEELDTIWGVITGNRILRLCHLFKISTVLISLAQCIPLKARITLMHSETTEKPSQNQHSFIIVFRQVIIRYHPKLFSKLKFRFSLSMWSIAS